MAENNRKQVSHTKIVEYWKDKSIHKSGRIITNKEAEEKYNFHDTIPVIEDWGEPKCWACSKGIIGDYEKNCESKCYDDEDIKKLWSDKKVKSKLQKRHIVPHAMGGADAPENLFLLCADCHTLSPDTPNIERFMRWIYRERGRTHNGWVLPSIMISEIDEELKARELPTIAEMGEQYPNMKFFDLRGFRKERAGLHGTRLAESTVIVVCADWIERIYREALNNANG